MQHTYYSLHYFSFFLVHCVLCTLLHLTIFRSAPKKFSTHFFTPFNKVVIYQREQKGQTLCIEKNPQKSSKKKNPSLYRKKSLAIIFQFFFFASALLLKLYCHKNLFFEK